MQLALGSLGVLSLAQLAGAAESSPLDAQGEPCPSCDPSAVEDCERALKKPVSAGVIHPTGVTPRSLSSPPTFLHPGISLRLIWRMSRSGGV